MKCTACGNESREGTATCTRCGAQLSTGGTHKLFLIDNRYEVLETIKAGAMGCVYKARDARLDVIVAVKKMLPSFTTPEELRYAQERFREEAKLLSKLRHEGMPKVTDFLIESDPNTGIPAHYLVMTFLEGKDLESLMAERQGRPFPTGEVLEYLGQILDVLGYLHSQDPPIIYRDLTPRNIIIDKGRLYLVDFGIARPMRTNQKGTAIGTPGYASPEQYKGFADPRSDIFALGALAHYLLTGANPEDSSKPLFTFDPPRSLNITVPEYLDRLVMSMVDVVPENRPGSAREIATYLAQHSGDGSQAPSRSRTRYPDIFEAVKKGDLPAVKDFLGQGIGVNEKNKAGFTPLHCAAQQGNAEMVEYLISVGARASVKNQYGYPPSHYAQEMGHDDLAAYLLGQEARETPFVPVQQLPPQQVHSQPPPPAPSPRPAAAPRAPKPSPGLGMLPKLVIAGVFLFFLAIVAFVVYFLTDPRMQLDRMGYGMRNQEFLECVKKGNLKATQCYLKAGMDPGVEGEFGETALHWAASEDRQDIVKLLCEHKVDVNARTKKGLTPLQWSAQFGVQTSTTAPLLIAQGADVKVKTSDGWTVLHWAAYKGDHAALALFISQGVDVNAPCSKGWTPLHIAAQGGFKAAVEVLLKNKASVNAKDCYGWTPLFWAIQEDRPEVVKLLVSQKADVNLKDKENCTPLKVAQRDQKKPIADYLASHGAR
jgi:ankyrin repeat protein/tRNA A-37 threonylcarbamoyl transferase component Bud32